MTSRIAISLVVLLVQTSFASAETAGKVWTRLRTYCASGASIPRGALLPASIEFVGDQVKHQIVNAQGTMTMLMGRYTKIGSQLLLLYMNCEGTDCTTYVPSNKIPAEIFEYSIIPSRTNEASNLELKRVVSQSDDLCPINDTVVHVFN